MNKVLVIAYNFPPAGGGGVIRTLKFCKYLSEFNWEPIVLTVKDPRGFEMDPDLSDEIRGRAVICRTRALELPGSLYKTNNIPGNGNAGGAGFLKRTLLNILKKLKGFVVVVDEKAGWIPFAIAAGKRAIQQNDVKVIYVSVKPFSSAIAAVALKKITQRPLVIDFRDGWVDFIPHFWPEKSGLSKWVETKLERWAIGNADKIISVNQNIIDDFKRRYPEKDNEAFKVITNGFDPEDFQDPQEPKKNNSFTITYAGSLYAKRSPGTFLEALKQLISEKEELRDKIRFRYIGHVSTFLDGLIKEKGMEEMLEKTGVLPHRHTIREIRKSDLLLFIEDQVEISDRLLPAKLFEYLASGVPVLGILKDGPSKELLLSRRGNRVRLFNDIGGIKKSLLEAINDVRIKDTATDPGQVALEAYERRGLTERLAGLFDEISR